MYAEVLVLLVALSFSLRVTADSPPPTDDLAPPATFEQAGVYATSEDPTITRTLDRLRERAEGSVRYASESQVHWLSFAGPV